jgi:hypothetical protein
MNVINLFLHIMNRSMISSFNFVLQNVKYWVRALYTCCDVTQVRFKYLRGLAMVSLNSLLIEFYIYTLNAYTYITLGSWERDVGRTEKQKRKNIFFFFFPSQTVSYPTACFANTLVYIRISCLCCLLRWGKGHTYIVKNAVLDWTNVSLRKVFLCKQELIYSNGN